MFTWQSLFQFVPAFFNSILILITSFFLQWGILPNHITVEPTVFLAENEYQIIWETQRQGAAWVTVGDEVFTDSIAGNLKWEQNIHKVSVPIEALDAARGYEISWQFFNQDVLGTAQGQVHSKAYDFRPIDFSDGLQVYHIADTHSIIRPAAETAKFWGGDLDLLILNGDILSDLLVPGMLTDGLRLAWEITGGGRPVLYARGNHETRGPWANLLSRYVGTPGAERWYFTTRVGPLWIAVYDLGELNADDHENYHGLADFTSYRERQTAFFDQVLANEASEFNAPGVEYRLLVSHIPIGNTSHAYGDFQRAWLAQANRMNLDLAMHGHWHRVQYIPAGTFRNFPETGPANYPIVVGSKPAHDADAGGIFTGAAIEIKGGETRILFTDQHHNVLREYTIE